MTQDRIASLVVATLILTLGVTLGIAAHPVYTLIFGAIAIGIAKE